MYKWVLLVVAGEDCVKMSLFLMIIGYFHLLKMLFIRLMVLHKNIGPTETTPLVVVDSNPNAPPRPRNNMSNL